MLDRIQKFFAILAAVVLLGIVGLYVYLATLEGKRAEPAAVLEVTRDRPLFFAHRGGLREAPENTIEAFESAIENGVDVLELDVHSSADGKLVVHHDGSLERTTNGEGLVGDKNLSELKGLDAGYRFTRGGEAGFPFRGKGVEMPTLREVFEKFPLQLINIEVFVIYHIEF